MGQQKSRFVSTFLPDGGGSSAADADAAKEVEEDLSSQLSLSAPNAAVIGAGVAGVHVAYELAKIGFDVTVFDRSMNVANGETQHSLPFVGVGLLEPSLVRASFQRELLRGLLLPTTCPDLIARGSLLHTVVNPVVYRWMWGRVRSCFSEKEVMSYTDNLSRVSHSVVTDLVKKHPQLQEHVFLGPVTVLNERREVALTAHAAPLMVDPVGWTRTLADVCRTQLGVRFALGERLEDTTTYLKYDVESVKSLRLSKPDPVDPQQRIYTTERFDVVVFAAGAETGTMTLPNSRLPIVGLSGLSVSVDHPQGGLKSALWSLFQRRAPANNEINDAGGASDELATAVVRPAAGTLALLSSRCNLYAYTWPGHPVAGDEDAAKVSTIMQSRVLPTSPSYVLQGLLSMDSTIKTTTHGLVTKQLERIESYLRVKCNRMLPLSPPTPPVSSSEEQQVHISEYVRAFTPDGVPLIDHNGGAFNCFVCSGFGDQAMDFAPGAAKVLGKLVEHQAQTLREEDLEKVKTWGVLTAKLAPSRRAEVEKDLQDLFNGVLPAEMPESKTITSYRSSTAVTATGGDRLHFDMNPYSTNRFQHLVRKGIHENTRVSLLNRVYMWEDRFVVNLEPYRIAFHHKLMEWVQRDSAPDVLRTIVFCYFFDEETDPALLKARAERQAAMQQVISQHEVAAAAVDGTNLSATERSLQKQQEMERQTRELYRR